MIAKPIFNTNTSLRLLLTTPLIALLGLTACSSTGGTASTSGTVSAVSFASGAAQLTVTTSGANVLTNVQLSDITLVR